MFAIERALTAFEIKVTASNDTDRPAVNTINSSGLLGDLCDNRWANTWGTTAGGDMNAGTVKGAAWVKYEFSKPHKITQLWVWNYNENVRRGLQYVTIEYTADGHVWEKLGDYQFVQAPGTPNYAHNTTVDFRGVRARAVVITAKEGSNIGNYGDPDGLYGLSEVRFYVTSASSKIAVSAKPTAPAAKLRLKLERGIAIDRQIRAIPPGPYATINREDIRLIKSMDFEFVKLLINPAVFQTGRGLNFGNMWYFEQIVNFGVEQRLPVVVCIHPENEFKIECLQDKAKFENLLGFYRELAVYIARRWNPDQLAIQLMTEPFGSSSKADDWNYWDTLQHRIWKVVRQFMPAHTMILSGDMTGQIEGLCDITPVIDANVMYSFTFYEPHIFSFQGGSWQPGGIQYLKEIPYPSNPDIVSSMQNYLSAVPEQSKAAMKAEIERYAVENWNRDRLKARMQQLVDWNQYYGGGRLKIWCAEFGCYQGANAVDRCRYIQDMRSLFDANHIGWSYWSYNETFSAMTSNRTPFGAASEQVPDGDILKALMPDK